MRGAAHHRVKGAGFWLFSRATVVAHDAAIWRSTAGLYALGFAPLKSAALPMKNGLARGCGVNGQRRNPLQAASSEFSATLHAGYADSSPLWSVHTQAGNRPRALGRIARPELKDGERGVPALPKWASAGRSAPARCPARYGFHRASGSRCRARRRGRIPRPCLHTSPHRLRCGCR